MAVSPFPWCESYRDSERLVFQAGVQLRSPPLQECPALLIVCGLSRDFEMFLMHLKMVCC